MLADARQIIVYGCGREALQMEAGIEAAADDADAEAPPPHAVRSG